MTLSLWSFVYFGPGPCPEVVNQPHIVGQLHKQPLWHQLLPPTLLSKNTQDGQQERTLITSKSCQDHETSTLRQKHPLHAPPVCCRPAELAACSYTHSPTRCSRAHRWRPGAPRWGRPAPTWWPEHRPPRSPRPPAASCSSWTLTSKGQ